MRRSISMRKIFGLVILPLVAVLLALSVSGQAGFQDRLADSALVLTKKQVQYDLMF